MEHVRKCNVCGKVYCYTDKDVNESQKNALLGAISAIGGMASVLGGGTIFHTSELNRRTDRYSDQVIDFNKCPHCNSRNTVLISEGDLIQLQVASTAQTTRTIEINSNASTDNLLKRAEMFLMDEEWDSADRYAEAVLDVDPENALAYVYKLMAALKVSDIEELKHQKKPFDENKHFKKAVRFGDEELVAKLYAAIDYINRRNEEERKKREEEQKRNQYNSFLQKMDSAKSEEDYLNLAQDFERISTYQDARKLAKQCREKAEVVHKDKIYDEAVALMGRNRIADINAAMDKFHTVFDWKDSSKKIEACKQQLAILEEQKEKAKIEAEKSAKKNKKLAIVAGVVACVIAVAVAVFNFVVVPNNKYNEAVEYFNSGAYDMAYPLFIELGDYKDSAEYLEKVKPVLLKETNANMYTIDYEYKDGKLVKSTSKALSSQYYYDKLITTFTYDSNGKLNKMVESGRVGSLKTEDIYEYDENENLVCVTHKKNGKYTTKDEYKNTYYEDDKLHTVEFAVYDWMPNLHKWEKDNMIPSYVITYDHEGNYKKVLDNGVVWTTEVDQYGNKIKETYKPKQGETQSWDYQNVYDKNGNLISVKSDSHVFTYTYENGLMTKMECDALQYSSNDYIVTYEYGFPK